MFEADTSEAVERYQVPGWCSMHRRTELRKFTCRGADICSVASTFFPLLQQEDLFNLGKLLMDLACSSLPSPSMDAVRRKPLLMAVNDTHLEYFWTLNPVFSLCLSRYFFFSASPMSSPTLVSICFESSGGIRVGKRSALSIRLELVLLYTLQLFARAAHPEELVPADAHDWRAIYGAHG